MNRTFTLTVHAAVGAMILSAGAVSANAFYSGYANGDPGNWDFATEQAGGPCAHTTDSKCCLKYNPTSACPLAHAESPYEPPTRHRVQLLSQ